MIDVTGPSTWSSGSIHQGAVEVQLHTTIAVADDCCTILDIHRDAADGSVEVVKMAIGIAIIGSMTTGASDAVHRHDQAP